MLRNDGCTDCVIDNGYTCQEDFSGRSICSGLAVFCKYTSFSLPNTLLSSQARQALSGGSFAGSVTFGDVVRIVVDMSGVYSFIRSGLEIELERSMRGAGLDTEWYYIMRAVYQCTGYGELSVRV